MCSLKYIPKKTVRILWLTVLLFEILAFFWLGIKVTLIVVGTITPVHSNRAAVRLVMPSNHVSWRLSQPVCTRIHRIPRRLAQQIDALYGLLIGVGGLDGATVTRCDRLVVRTTPTVRDEEMQLTRVPIAWLCVQSPPCVLNPHLFIMLPTKGARCGLQYPLLDRSAETTTKSLEVAHVKMGGWNLVEYR